MRLVQALLDEQQDASPVSDLSDPNPGGVVGFRVSHQSRSVFLGIGWAVFQSLWAHSRLPACLLACLPAAVQDNANLEIPVSGKGSFNEAGKMGGRLSEVFEKRT